MRLDATGGTPRHSLGIGWRLRRGAGTEAGAGAEDIAPYIAEDIAPYRLMPL